MNYRNLLAVLICVFPVSAFATGAIAVDDEAGSRDAGYGIATGYDTPADAKQAAMDMCVSYGNTACRVVAWFETCGTYAASKDYYGVGWGANQHAADEMALDKCGSGCKIVVSECE